MSYLMLDLLSTQASAEELTQLKHPMVGGVILFSRNYTDRPQLVSLVESLRVVRPDLLIAVDHEGEEYSALGMVLPIYQLWETFFRLLAAI